MEVLMRIIICDDDNEIVVQLNQMISEFFQNIPANPPEIVCYNNGDDLLSDSEDKTIVFLDIEMPGINGIMVGNELMRQNKNTIIMVVTSYIEYLDDAMRFNVFRYLTKPLDEKRIYRNMKDALEVINKTERIIPITTPSGIYSVLLSNIIAVEVSLHKVIVYTTERNFESSQNMNYWRETLNTPNFFSPHRSFIVNLKYVSNFDHSLIHLYNNQVTAYLTRRKYKEFKNAYLLHLESLRY